METEQLALLVTGAVGLGAPSLAALFAWLRERQQAERERVAKDLEDLRALLDELLPAMFEHTNQLIALERWHQDNATGQDRSDRPPSLRDTRRQLYASSARLVIRRGREDRLVASLGSYLRATDDAMTEIQAMWETREPFDSDDELARRGRRYWVAYEGFADACKAVAGSVER